MIQNTRGRDRSCGHSRLTDVLGQRVHHGLVQVLDDAIIHAVDMNGDLGDRPGRASVEASNRNRADTVIAGPGQRVHDVGRTTG